MQLRYGVTAACVILVCVVGALLLWMNISGKHTAIAQENTSEQKPWNVRCAETKEGEDKRCELFQRLNDSKSGKRFAEFIINEPVGLDHIRGTIILPLGILVSQPVVMQVDDGEMYGVPLQYCDMAGCAGFLKVDDEMLKKLKRGNIVSFIFVLPNGQKTKLPMSLDGFTKSLKAAL